MRIVRRFRLRGIDFPVGQVVKPAALAGVENGKIPPEKLVTFPLPQGGEGRLLAGAPWDAWRALAHLAQLEREVTLTATSSADTYRSYAQQEAGFRRRFTTAVIPTTDKRLWNGVWWRKRPGVAGIAVPGTSNHGYGLAVDHACWENGKLTRSIDWLKWLAATAPDLGWSWEAPTEDWHIRYCAGDQRPPRVVAICAELDKAGR